MCLITQKSHPNPIVVGNQNSSKHFFSKVPKGKTLINYYLARETMLAIWRKKKTVWDDN